MDINTIIKDNLLPYQINHTKNLISIIKNNHTGLDASDTGTGKTYCAIALCAQLKLKPIIICPKSVIYTWSSVCKLFKVEPIMIVNYETIKFGKYYQNNKRVECPFLKINDKPENKNDYFEWKEIDNSIFIFDEVHKCSELDTLNGKLLYAAKKKFTKILLLSATVSDIPEKFRLFFYILNFIDPSQVQEKNISYNRYQIIMANWIFRDANPMLRIHNMLYPDRASRMRIDVLGDLFPQTQISAVPYTIEDKRQKDIQKAYSEINNELMKLKDKSAKDRANILVKVMRAHQKIEMLKIPLFVELVNDYLENNLSVVIFVNYTQTLLLLAKLLNTNCIIYGEQNSITREQNINDFQDNKEKIIICNIKAGSIGISLHDIKGNHPRVSLISPTWNSIELQQALGRIHRAGGKSKSLQRIIYIANTIEEKIAEKIKIKLKDINTINNGDLDLTNIDFEKERIKF